MLLMLFDLVDISLSESVPADALQFLSFEDARHS